MVWSGSVVEQLEASWNRLNAFQAFWERMGAFSRLGRLASTVPYGIVWYGMVWYGMYVSKHKDRENLGTFRSVWERLAG